jgi:serine/threonine-protein kinase
VKLLDFGLARPVAGAQGDATATELTQAGALAGTPQYMAPEQLRGQPLDGRTDVFAAGALVFEMLAGRKAFEGRTLFEVTHAVLHEQPPVLSGSPAVAALDRAVRRALSKRPEDRQPSAEALAAELLAARALEDSGAQARAQALTRLIVLPFRLLRPDPEIDFLGFSLPDAITASLSGLGSLLVRSSLAAARYAGEAPDLERLSREADVDVVLSGTLLRAGERLRVSTQLVEAPGGTLVCSHQAQVAVGDVFQLEDELVRRIVEALAVPLSARDTRRLADESRVPPGAYELYLRANRLSLDPLRWHEARALYERCVAEAPEYAPAWARCGRVLRLLGKYMPDPAGGWRQQARESFERALRLDPDLPLAHNLRANLRVEEGQAPQVVVELVERARQGRPDPELFAGLTHACRYAGLLEASLAAHEQARRLDPQVRTSVNYTHFVSGAHELALAASSEEEGIVRAYVLAALGREAEALATFAELERRVPEHLQRMLRAQRLALEGQAGPALELTREVLAWFRDPEGIYMQARFLARLDLVGETLELLEGVLTGGYVSPAALESEAWLGSRLRSEPRFVALLPEARRRAAEAAAAFAAAGGPALLGLGSARP